MLVSVALSGAALFGGGEAAPHTFGAINDPLSHGSVGDNLLSLNEAIRLHNNTLPYNQLSAAEQAQVLLIPGTGTQTFLTWGRLDASSTPVITIEQDLDVIINTTYGFYLSSDNGNTVFDFSGANITRGMRATTNSLQMRDITFSGGPSGLDVVQTDIAGQIGLAANNCRFENQTQFGVRVSTTTANGFGKMYLEGCVFDGAPTGVVWDEGIAGRTSFFDLHDCRMTGGTNGVDITLGDGGTGRYILDRVVVEASTSGIRIARPNGASRAAQLIWQHVEVRSPDSVWVDCSPIGSTTVQLRMLHLRDTSTLPNALHLGAGGDDLAGVIEDSAIEGSLLVRSGGGSAPLSIWNVRCETGFGAFETSPSQPLSVSDSRFDNLQILLQGTAAIPFDNCCFVNTSLTATAASPAVCTGSFLPNPGAFVTVTNARPAEQLGSMKVLPDVPTIGSTITFQADLPTGLFGAFLLGFTTPYPNLLPQPLHVYGMVGNTFLVPGIVRFQQTFLWTIPNYPIYRGLDLVTAIAVLPDPGVSALPVQIAPGRRFALQ